MHFLKVVRIHHSSLTAARVKSSTVLPQNNARYHSTGPSGQNLAESSGNNMKYSAGTGSLVSVGVGSLAFAAYNKYRGDDYSFNGIVTNCHHQEGHAAKEAAAPAEEVKEEEEESGEATEKAEEGEGHESHEIHDPESHHEPEPEPEPEHKQNEFDLDGCSCNAALREYLEECYDLGVVPPLNECFCEVHGIMQEEKPKKEEKDHSCLHEEPPCEFSFTLDPNTVCPPMPKCKTCDCRPNWMKQPPTMESHFPVPAGETIEPMSSEGLNASPKGFKIPPNCPMAKILPAHNGIQEEVEEKPVEKKAEHEAHEEPKHHHQPIPKQAFVEEKGGFFYGIKSKFAGIFGSKNEEPSAHEAHKNHEHHYEETKEE